MLIFVFFLHWSISPRVPVAQYGWSGIFVGRSMGSIPGLADNFYVRFSSAHAVSFLWGEWHQLGILLRRWGPVGSGPLLGSGCLLCRCCATTLITTRMLIRRVTVTDCVLEDDVDVCCVALTEFWERHIVLFLSKMPLTFKCHYFYMPSMVTVYRGHLWG